MAGLLIQLCFYSMVVFSLSDANFTMDIESLDNQPLTCRTDRRFKLMLEDYRLDTCGRCYKYMSRVCFHRKFIYVDWVGIRDPLTNITYEPNPHNASQGLLDSFKDESYVTKWAACCLAALSCCNRMLKAPPIEADGNYCPRTWDGWQCWEDTIGGVTAKENCPNHIYFDNETPMCPKYAHKECGSNGSWYEDEFGREYSNYTTCGTGEEHRRFLYFHIATYIISIVALVPALIIFSVYKQLQVHRISMHKNLFLSLFLNGLTVVLFKSIVIVDEINRVPDQPTIMDKNGAPCTILFILTKYFRTTNYMWMFCEGFYLHKLIAAAFAEQKNLLMFYLIGWVMPLLPVGGYAILRKLTDDEKCWVFPIDHIEWIINAPNLLSLMVNLIFLCNIIRVLVTKLRATHSNEPSQYRKAVRATLVLVPLFGLHFILIIYRPPVSARCGFLEAYTYFSHAMDGLQGMIVSLIFCYANGEVLYLLRRSYQRYRLSKDLRGRPGQSSLMMNPVSVTQVSSMAETTTSHINNHLHGPKTADDDVTLV